jgi:hypothetical protein
VNNLCVLANVPSVILLLVLCFNLEAKIERESEQLASVNNALDLYSGGAVF